MGMGCSRDKRQCFIFLSEIKKNLSLIQHAECKRRFCTETAKLSSNYIVMAPAMYVLLRHGCIIATQGTTFSWRTERTAG